MNVSMVTADSNDLHRTPVKPAGCRSFFLFPFGWSMTSVQMGPFYWAEHQANPRS